MDEMKLLIEGAQVLWPGIQPAISGVVGALVTRLFLRGEKSIEAFEKIKQTKFSDIADELLRDGYISHLEYYKCKNFNKIAEKADEVYSKQKQEQAQEKSHVNIDWFVRFFDDAGNISDDDMQNLWAKVLAGEIRHPNSYSLKTLDTLRNLSKDEAKALKRVISYAMKVGEQHFIVCDKETISRYNYYSELIMMYDCGIIENTAACVFCDTVERGLLLFSIGHIAAVAHNKKPVEIQMSRQRFTRTGSELLRLGSSNEEFALEFIDSYSEKFPSLQMTANRRVANIGKEILLKKEDLLVKYRADANHQETN